MVVVGVGERGLLWFWVEWEVDGFLENDSVVLVVPLDCFSRDDDFLLSFGGLSSGVGDV